MSEKFGPRIIKISNLKGFAEKLQSVLGAKRFYFNHVIYNDLKMFLVETDKIIRLSKTEPPTDFDPLLLNGALFNLLYKNTFLPSLFVKPMRFSGEEELRLVFELPRDAALELSP
jgi:hypothetical protein